jgi:type I restriction enzyme S subunit
MKPVSQDLSSAMQPRESITSRGGREFLDCCHKLKADPAKKAQPSVSRYDFALPDLPYGWCWASLSEVCERVSVGHVGPTSQYFSASEDSVPLIRSQDVRPGILHLDNAIRVAPEFHRKLKKSKLWAGDILFVRVGANRGDCCVVPAGIGEVNCANVVFARPLFDTGFFGFYFRSQFAQKLLLNVTTGAAQGVINTECIARMPVPVPPSDTQRRIAVILSAYDDLIENNTRRIRVLEQMAQMLYREWFVNLCFPGHEKARMVDSELGQIPEDWTIEPITNVAEILGGGTPATGVPEYWENGNIDWYSPSDLTAASSMFMFGSTKKITELGLKKSSARLFPANSVMMTSRATIGVVSINRTPSCTNQGFITCVPGNRTSHFHIYFWMLENKDKITSIATGATFKEINKRTFRELPIVVPSAAVLSHFQDIVSPICGLIENLLRRNKILRATRDLLLPKLVSGEVSVEQIESEVPVQTV